ncbi:MAG: right-handed parallel beta-helix repeat-containing protein [Leptospiraceae bacterium]|nr:right-handed parallel beta-helix repeat-containing protein [Leptospiraceae bacterium]
MNLKILLLSLLTLIFSCAGENDKEGSYAHVLMMDNTFYPPLSKLAVGEKLKFKNVGNNPHNALSVDKSWGTDKTFGKLDMQRNDSTFVTYPEKGVFPYYCSFHATPDGKLGMVGEVVVGDVEYTAGKKGIGGERNTWSGVTRKVPSFYPTIQNAVDASLPGDLILIAPGVYKEEVIVTTPSLIIRGEDRSKVIIDGEFLRGNGIMIVGANGVTVENLTARNHTLNGVYWTGVKGYRGSYITAYNNGDYGIYAFNSTEGVMEHSYASGSPDSGFYIGQCDPCKAVIYDVIAENNALGYSGTNSGGDLYILSSIWRNNVLGLGPNSLDRELLPPEKETTIIHNLVYNNNNLDAPAKSMEFATIGNGIAIMGGIKNRIEKNVVLDHKNYGITVSPNLDERFWIANQNMVRDNIVLYSGRGDLVLGGPFSAGNCFENNEHFTSSPPMLQVFHGCDSFRYPLVGETSSNVGFFAYFIYIAMGHYQTPSYKNMPAPPEQMEMPEEKKKIIEPAHIAFESRLPLVKTSKLPEITKGILEKYKSEAHSGYPLNQPFPHKFLSFIFYWVIFFIPFGIYSSWTGTALMDIKSKSLSGFWFWMILSIPFLGSLIYHLSGKSSLNSKVRYTMILGPILFFLVVVIYAGVGVAKTF